MIALLIPLVATLPGIKSYNECDSPHELSIRGRVISSSGDRLVGAQVCYRLKLESPNACIVQDGKLTQEDGKFFFSIPTHTITSLNTAMPARLDMELQVYDSKTHMGLYCQREIRGSLDLGDLIALPLHSKQCRIVDGAGLPIRAAKVYAGMLSNFVSSETTFNGKTEIKLIVGIVEGLVLAPGYTLTTIDLSEDLPTVTMAPAAILELVLEEAVTEVCFMGLENCPEYLFSGRAYLFQGQGKNNIDWARQALCTGTWTRTDANGRVCISPNVEGKLIVHDIISSCRMSVTVCGKQSERRLDTIRLQPGEHRLIRL